MAGFLEVGHRLGAEKRASGDGALAFQVYPGLTVEVILWVADDEFRPRCLLRCHPAWTASGNWTRSWASWGWWLRNFCGRSHPRLG